MEQKPKTGGLAIRAGFVHGMARLVNSGRAKPSLIFTKPSGLRREG
jgi:hypothetical protein